MKRMCVQILAFVGSNAYVQGFLTGKIFKGMTKQICVPGLNCYSCPGAVGACPIGALQAVMGSMNYHFSYYVLGSLTLLGTILGRWVCGWLCPFGLVQDVMFKLTKELESFRGLLYTASMECCFIL